MKWNIKKYLVSFYKILFFLSLIICLCPALALSINIDSDTLFYIAKENQYIAIGNVKIKKDDISASANKAIFSEDTKRLQLIGNVIYEDKTAIINAEVMDKNLDDGKGSIAKAIIFLKPSPRAPDMSSYWIIADIMTKIENNHYYTDKAFFTSCSSEPYLCTDRIKDKYFGSFDEVEKESNPDWSFKGRNIDIVVGDKISGTDVTYRIKNFPILYIPYFWAPIKKDRQTGFLIPTIGYSSQKKMQLSPRFFWAIDDNKDTTLWLDYNSKYGKKNIGKGIEYRYLDFNGKGIWSGYYVFDKTLDKNLFQIKGLSEIQSGKYRGYTDVDLINNKDFYRLYGREISSANTLLQSFSKKTKILFPSQRFLQSTAEGSASFHNSRFYLLGQHWKDLGPTNNFYYLQKIPEIGYIVNPIQLGEFSLNLSSNIASFQSKDNWNWQKAEITPTAVFSTGKQIKFKNALVLKETIYKLGDNNKGSFDNFYHREAFQYKSNVLSNFSKGYGSFTHILEPSIEYTFIPETRLFPQLDSIDTFSKTSIVQASIYNQFLFSKYSLYLRIIQPYNFNAASGVDKFMPTTFSASYAGDFSINLDVTQNFAKNQTEIINSSFGFKPFQSTSMSIGQVYTRNTNSVFHKFGIDSKLSKRISNKFDMGYDSKGGLRESANSLTYTQDCWDVQAIVSVIPASDIEKRGIKFQIFYNLRGLGI